MITLAKRAMIRAEPKLISVNENLIVYIEESVTTVPVEQGEAVTETITRVHFGENHYVEVSNRKEEIDRLINSEHLKWLETQAKLYAQWRSR